MLTSLAQTGIGDSPSAFPANTGQKSLIAVQVSSSDSCAAYLQVTMDRVNWANIAVVTLPDAAGSLSGYLKFQVPVSALDFRLSVYLGQSDVLAQLDIQ